MKRDLRVLATVSALLLSMGTASAQKQGGILKIGHFDSPASMSMLEESTLATNRPMDGRVQQPRARRTAYATASTQPRRASR